MSEHHPDRDMNEGAHRIEFAPDPAQRSFQGCIVGDVTGIRSCFGHVVRKRGETAFVTCQHGDAIATRGEAFDQGGTGARTDAGNEADFPLSVLL